MARRERLQNQTSSTLDGTINDSVTTVTLVDGSSFPSEGDFRVRIESEILLVTARSSNDLTVVRGAEGTTAAAHASGESCRIVLTEDATEKYVRESVQYHGLSPANRIYLANGSTGTESDFTWLNQGGATAADLSDGGIRLKIPAAAGPNFRGKYITAPSAPYTVIARMGYMFDAELVSESQPRLGIFFRESSTGELLFFFLRRATDAAGDHGSLAFGVDRFNTATSFNANVAKEQWWMSHNELWIKIEDDNADLIFSFSPDGVDFFEVHSEGRTAFMAGGPDQIGFGGNSSGSTHAMWQTIHHFSVE